MKYLAAAIGVNLCMTFLMKYSETHGGNRYALNIWNYITGVLVSWLLLTDKSGWRVDDGGITLAAGVCNGILFVAALVCIQISILRNGAPLTTTFNRLGVLIPTILSAFLFREIPQPLQMAGLGICIAAIVYMNRGGSEERPAFGAGLALVFLLGGVTDFIAKWYGRHYGAEEQKCFVLYTFAAALLVSVALFIRNKGKMTWQDVLIGIGVGIPNQLSTLFLLRAASQLPAYIVYPTYSAGLILLVNVINYLLFKELLTGRQYLATGMIGIGLVCINLL